MLVFNLGIKWKDVGCFGIKKVEVVMMMIWMLVSNLFELEDVLLMWLILKLVLGFCVDGKMWVVMCELIDEDDGFEWILNCFE